MDLASVIILSTPLLVAIVFVLRLATSGEKDAPIKALPAPDPSAETYAEKWMRKSPWPELAQAQGWTCTSLLPQTGRPAYRIRGRHEGRDFEVVSSLRAGVLEVTGVQHYAGERLLLRSRTRQPPDELVFRESRLHWSVTGATLSPFQTWLPEQGDTQALEWKDPYLELTLSRPGDPEQCLREAMALFTALRHAEFPFWYAERPGWTLKLDSTGQWPRLSRLVDGVLVNANLEWVQGALRTRIMAPLPPQRARFTLTHPDFKEGDKVNTRHPIADSLLHAEGDGEALHGLLQDADAFSAIMAIVHGHPGSRLTQDRIELIAAGDMGDGLLQAMNKVVRAASAISASAE
jgi:hypothetical protein